MLYMYCDGDSTSTYPSAQAGGDEVSVDSDISGAKLELELEHELELERPPAAAV
jgi:hypothetical protein